VRVRVSEPVDALSDVHAAPQAAPEVKSAVDFDLAVPSAPAFAH
jgi:hypothetical protein